MELSSVAKTKLDGKKVCFSKEWRYTCICRMFYAKVTLLESSCAKSNILQFLATQQLLYYNYFTHFIQMYLYLA